MNKQGFYAIAALSVIPGAAIHAEVGVTNDVNQMSVNGKVTVDFGTLVPGTYKVTGMISSGYVNGMKYTINGQETTLTSETFVKEFTLTESKAVTLVVEGADIFTLGTYMLKLEWNLDKTAWNTLISNVKTKVGTTFDGKLTDAHKTNFLNQLNVKEEDIEALADSYDTYMDNELWKLDNGEDAISQAIKTIESNAEAQVIEDCWATKTAAYNTAIASMPTQTRINTLSTNISNLNVNKDKRQNSFNTINGQINTFKANAQTALGTKPTTWQAAIADEWTFNPTPSSATINTNFSNLETYVSKDQANYSRYTTMTTRVTAANTSIGNVNTNSTKNLAARAINAQEKSDIKAALTTYGQEAQSAYNTAIATDGADFTYDNNYSNLSALEGRITALSNKITSDNNAYNSIYTTITGYVTAAKTTFYNEKMAELTNYINEDCYALKLEDAQGLLIAKKNEIVALGNGYTTDYNAGNDLDAAAANTAIEGIKAQMTQIVTDAKNTIDGYRAAYTGFQGQIATLTTNISAKKTTAQQAGVYDLVKDEIDAVEALITQLTANLDAANNSPYDIANSTYAPTTTAGKSIAEVQNAIDAIDLQPAIDYVTAIAAINAAKAQLTVANTTIDGYKTSERTGYGTPSAYWTAQYNAILASLDGNNGLLQEVEAQYAAGGFHTYYTNTFAGNLAAITGDNGTINDYIATAKEAIDKYCGFYAYFFNDCPSRLTTLTNAVKDLPIYEDTEVLFDASTNYKAIIDNIQGIINDAQAALTGEAGVITLTGDAHLAELTRMCEQRNNNNYANYYTGVLVKKADGTELGKRGNTGGLANTLSYLVATNTTYTISSIQTLYNHTYFDNYKAANTPTVDASDPDREKAVKENIIAQLNNCTYDDNKTLAENKAAIDAIIAPYAAEMAAAEIVDYNNSLLSTNYTELKGLVNASKTANTNHMGNQEDALQTEYSDLIAALDAIEALRDKINTALLGPDIVDDTTTVVNEAAIPENIEFNKYNSNVEKVQAFNELLTQLGKSTDVVDAQGNGSLYAKYQSLKTRAEAKVAAKTANDARYATLSQQFDASYTQGMQYKLNAITNSLGSYSSWTQSQVQPEINAIQILIDNAKGALDAANYAETLTAQSTIENQSTIESRINTLKNDTLPAKDAQYKASEKQFVILSAALSDYNYNSNYNNYKYNNKKLDECWVDGLGYKLNQAWSKIETDYALVANDFVAEKTRIRGLITNAQTALQTAKDSVALTAQSTIATVVGEGYEDIDAAITTMKTDAQNKFAKVNAHTQVVNKYYEVSAALGEERTDAIAAAGDANTTAGAGAIAYYRGLFNNEGGFAKRLAAIQTEYEAAYDDTNLQPSTYQSTYVAKLDSLQNAFTGVKALAAANKTAYDNQMAKYNEAKGLYNAYMDNLANTNIYAEQTYVADAVTAMEDYSWEDGELASALTTLEGFYTTGAAVANNATVTAALSTIEDNMQAIIEALNGEAAGSYYAQVKAANDLTYGGDGNKHGVEWEIAQIRPAYNAAVQVLNSYTGAQDATLKALITEQSSALNNAVFGAIQKITDFTTEATNARDAATRDKKIWDATELVDSIQAYVQNLNDTKDAFLAVCKVDIVNYWNGVKTNRQQTITGAYNTLNNNGYIANETAENIFASNYAFIAQGDGFVYEEKENEVTQQVETVVKDGIIDITGLDNLVFGNGALEVETFASAVQSTATTFAQNFVNDKIAVYTTATTGKKDVDLAAIKAIFTDKGHAVDYGKPANADGVVMQFSTIVLNTVTAAENLAAAVTYQTDYNAQNGIAAKLASYDSQIVTLKATATQWVADQEAADATLATAQGELTAAQANLTTAVNARQTELDALSALINASSVAATYANDLANIQALITTAKGYAEAAVPTTLALVNTAKTNVATQQGLMTGASQGTPIYGMSTVESAAINDLKSDLRQLIPDLKVQFNAYAASQDADQAKVTDWNTRIQAAITLTDANNASTLAEMVALEEDLAKLRTEMGNISGEMTATIADFKSRTATLQNAALAEADYGSKANDFATRLSAIQEAAATLAAEVTQHETDGDILPYVDNLESRISAQETVWTNLQSDASAQATKVANAKALAETLNARVTALTTATLDGEYSPADAVWIEQWLDDIVSTAQGIASDIADYGEDIADDEADIDYRLTNLEEDMAMLQEEAADAAQAWADQKEASNTAWATLSGMFGTMESKINEANTAIAGFTLGDNEKSNYQAFVGSIEEDFISQKTALQTKSENYTLNQIDVNNYTSWQVEYLGYLTDYVLNPAARLHAMNLYVNGGNELDAARDEAGDAYSAWTFAKNVKAEINGRLSKINGDLSTFKSQVRTDNNSYSKLESYATKAAALLARYQAIIDEINSYTIAFGDANTDGKVNVLDYRTVANMILNPGLQPNAETQDKLFKAIDINQNEVIEVGDLTAVVNFILDADWQGWAASRGDRATSGESLTMATNQTQHGTQRIAVSLNNVHNYTAFQLDVVLPEGMTIVGQSLSDRAGETHTLLSRPQQDGSIRFLASSIKAETFKGSNGAVLYIDVETSNDYVGGDVELVNILFSDVNAATRSFSVGSEATGIETASVLDSLKQQVYNLGGKLMDGVKKGINIIRHADGTVEKKVMK